MSKGLTMLFSNLPTGGQAAILIVNLLRLIHPGHNGMLPVCGVVVLFYSTRPVPALLLANLWETRESPGSSQSDNFDLRRITRYVAVLIFVWMKWYWHHLKCTRCISYATHNCVISNIFMFISRPLLIKRKMRNYGGLLTPTSKSLLFSASISFQVLIGGSFFYLNFSFSWRRLIYFSRALMVTPVVIVLFLLAVAATSKTIREWKIWRRWFSNLVYQNLRWPLRLMLLAPRSKRISAAPLLTSIPWWMNTLALVRTYT